MSHTELKHFHSASGPGWGSAALRSAETVGGSRGGGGMGGRVQLHALPQDSGNSSLAGTLHMGRLECLSDPVNETGVR